MIRLATILAAAAIAAGALALGGCGAKKDDPANPPLLGQWTIQRKAVGLRKNGTSVPRAEYGRTFLRSGASPAGDTNVCTEPTLADQQWLADQIGSQLGRACRITEESHTGFSAQARGVCGEGRRGDERPNETSFLHYADFAADAFSASVEATIRTDLPSGAAELTAMTVKIEGTRTGECGG
jgi:hypothetical protein